MSDKPSHTEIDLREYGRILWRRKWSVLLMLVATVGGAMFLSFRQTPVYTSTAKVLVTPIGPGVTPPAPNLDTERELVESAVVAGLVAENLGLERSPDSLLDSLEVSVETGTEILQISYTDPSPPRARNLAQGFAAAYLEFRLQHAQELVQGQVDDLTARITATNEELAEVKGELRTTTSPTIRDQLASRRDALIAQLGALQQQLQSLNSQIAGQTGGQIVQPAELPGSPSSPSHVRDGALALATGLVLGIGLAFLRERLDDRLHGDRDIEEAGVHILSMVPRMRDWKDRDETELVTIDAPGSAPAEAYRTLRTNLQFLGVREDIRVVCVTSTAVGDGKSTTVANLGVVLAQAGRRVFLVSCDLRRPRLHRFFGASNEAGLSLVLSGQKGLADSFLSPGIDNLRLLPSGPTPPNPAELLASDRFLMVLDDLRSAADFVILDTPPVLAVSDTLTIASKADATLLVIDANGTTRSALRQARQQLDKVGATLSGAVLNSVDRGSGHYGYGYGGYYEDYSENGAKGRPDSNGKATETSGKSRRARNR